MNYPFYADIAGGGLFLGALALGVILILGAVVGIIALISFLILRHIKKKNADK